MMRKTSAVSYLPAQAPVAEEFTTRMRMLRDDKGEIPNFLNELYIWALECKFPPSQFYVFLCICYSAKGRHQISLPLITNFSQKLTKPSKEISYPVGDLCGCFTKLTLPSAYTLHSNPIPPTDGTNSFTSMFLSSYCGEF